MEEKNNAAPEAELPKQQEKERTDNQQSITPFAPLVPFDAANKLELFPVKSLPRAVGDMVEALSVSTQTPPEMGGVLSLAVLSTLYQKRFRVEITPDWSEPLSLFCVAVAAPGERKSSVISALTSPIYEYEREQRLRDAGKIEQNRTQRQIMEAQLAQLKKSAAKEPDNVEATEQALDLAGKLASFKDFHPLRLLADDATPEKLVDLMEQQDGCLTICSAEGGIFDAMSGRYDKTVNLDVYLKAHAGDPVIVDRISRRTSHIDMPRLTMLLTIQPEILNGIMGNTTFRGRGLCGRFLYAVCDNSRIGHREVSPPSIPYEVREEYRYFVRHALNSQYKGTIRLSPDGDSLRQSYQMVIEERLGTEWENMRDWGGKLTGAMLRIAALLHCAEGNTDPTKAPINARTINRAISIAECLSAHAVRAYELMGSDPDIEDARYILRRLSSERKVTRSELWRLCRGHFKKSAEMEPALEILIDRGYLRTIAKNIGYNNRQQLLFEVNPAV